MIISIEQIVDYAKENFYGVVVNSNWGEKGIFYNPENKLSKGVYILTFKEKDGPNDSASKMNRGGLYRLNFGLSKESYIKLFGVIPQRPKAGQTIIGDYDFTDLNVLTPHPVYGWMCWVSILNPTLGTFIRLKPLLNESYHLAVKKYQKRK